MFLAHLFSLIAGIFLGIGTNLLVSPNTNVISAVSFLLAGVFISSFSYINSTVYEDCIKVGSTKKVKRKQAWNHTLKLWRIEVTRKVCARICLFLAIICIAVALIKIHL